MTVENKPNGMQPDEGGGAEVVTRPDGEKPEASRDRSIYVCRFALALCCLPDGSEPMFTTREASVLATEVRQKFEAALDNDSRVAEVLVSAVGATTDNARTYTFWREEAEQDDLVEATRPYEVLRFNEVLQFRVRVPAKNQPLYRNISDVPSDDYLVAWDGVALAVQWHQDNSRATGSGGHVVFDILQQVGEAAGYPVQIRACSPGCHHRFIHADFVTFAKAPDGVLTAVGDVQVGTSMALPFDQQPSDEENLRRTYRLLGSSVHKFAETRALVENLEYLQWRAWSGSGEMLSLNYDRYTTKRGFHPILSIKKAWTVLLARRRVRHLIAELWLILATIEVRLRMWSQLDEQLDLTIASHKLSDLRPELDTASPRFQNLDLSLIRESLQETASRLEGRTLVLATFAGALAALAGATVTILLT